MKSIRKCDEKVTAQQLGVKEGDEFVFAMASKIETLQYKGFTLIKARSYIEDPCPETKLTFDATIKSFQSEF